MSQSPDRSLQKAKKSKLCSHSECWSCSSGDRNCIITIEWPLHDPLFLFWDEVNLAQFSPAASFPRKAKWLSKFKQMWVSELLVPTGGLVSGYVNLRGLWPHLWVNGHLSTFLTLLPMLVTWIQHSFSFRSTRVLGFPLAYSQQVKDPISTVDGKSQSALNCISTSWWSLATTAESKLKELEDIAESHPGDFRITLWLPVFA